VVIVGLVQVQLDQDAADVFLDGALGDPDSAGRLWISASGPASPVLSGYGRRVGSLGPGLTSDSADAVRAVLRDDLPAGPQVYGTCRRCRSDLPDLGKRPGFTGPGGQRVRAIPHLRKG